MDLDADLSGAGFGGGDLPQPDLIDGCVLLDDNRLHPVLLIGWFPQGAFPFRLNRNGAPDSCVDAFSSRGPVASLCENASGKPIPCPLFYGEGFCACNGRLACGKPASSTTSRKERRLPVVIPTKFGNASLMALTLGFSTRPALGCAPSRTGRLRTRWSLLWIS
ncbi:hypothetical protein XI02_19245 [Bradyrhizobium sp. CCBAU 21365]|nr:hypothetical protein XI02_19245 [Bradyrhizobium sp. CCBAU 21365]